MHRAVGVGLALWVMGLWVAALSCGGAGPDIRQGVRPAVAVSEPPPAFPLKLDMDAIFPHSPGRELALDNCTN